MRHIELNNEITQMQDGFYQLHKDKEALEVFMEEAERIPFLLIAWQERMEYMKEHDYYYNVLDEYSLEEDQRKYITSLMVKTSSSNLIWQHLSSTKIMR